MPTRTQQSDLIGAAYASHGDTKHVLLFPANPGEAFDLSADAFDLAERLQTPVLVMSDLDIGMNDWVCDPFKWDDKRRHDRGKVLSAAELDAAVEWGRYRDVDGDGIPYRTIPGVHPNKGAYFTRGSSHDENARYTEDGRIHARVLDRLLRKFSTAAEIVPKPVIDTCERGSSTGIVYFGSTQPAVLEALDMLKADGCAVDAMRLRAFPFSKEVIEFANAHDQLLVVEQNRDGQMRSLLMMEAGIAGAKMQSILNIDGYPLTARFVADAVKNIIRPAAAAAAE